jgi:hypothetical protein
MRDIYLEVVRIVTREQGLEFELTQCEGACIEQPRYEGWLGMQTSGLLIDGGWLVRFSHKIIKQASNQPAI